MSLKKKDQSRIFAAVKKFRGDNPSKMTPVLSTPIGTFHGDDVLEGFAADTEHLGRSNEGDNFFDQGFYKLCKLDNLYIFEFSCTEDVKIPPMTHILNSKMKAGKACDIYHLTVEHLRHCGSQAQQKILNYNNRILNYIYYLSCPHIKLGLGTPIYKAKKKPLAMSSSYTSYSSYSHIFENVYTNQCCMS